MIELKTQFPIGLNVNWIDATLAPEDDFLKDWLLDLTSLTARLKSHCDVFRVDVVGQHIECCQAHEANEAIKEGEDVLVREVVLFCDDVPHVFARSLLPLTSLTGNERKLANLGEQPLGQVLFNNPKLHREILQLAELEPTQRVCELALMLNCTVEHNLWGRRSLFTIDNKPLMVAEIFLPAAKAYQNWHCTGQHSRKLVDSINTI